MILDKHTPHMKSMLIADGNEEEVFFYLPPDLSHGVLSEMKNVYSTFKDVGGENQKEKGKVSSQDGFFFHYKYPGGLFYVVYVNKKYPENFINDFISEIEDLLVLKYLEYNDWSTYFSKLSQNDKIEMFRIFDKYKFTDNEGNLDNTTASNKDYSSLFLVPQESPAEKALVSSRLGDDHSEISIRQLEVEVFYYLINLGNNRRL
jgi:hypothetical protein